MPIRNQPKHRSYSIHSHLISERQTRADSNFPQIKLIRTSSAEQLTRVPVQFYPLRSGGHARIFLAKSHQQELIVKKGITAQDQADLQKEKQVLLELADSPHVVNLHPQGEIGRAHV